MHFFPAVVDSLGKEEAGLLEGNFVWLGSFEECESATDYVDPNENVKFTSEYCVLIVVGLFNNSILSLILRIDQTFREMGKS